MLEKIKQLEKRFNKEIEYLKTLDIKELYKMLNNYFNINNKEIFNLLYNKDYTYKYNRESIVIAILYKETKITKINKLIKIFI